MDEERADPKANPPLSATRRVRLGAPCPIRYFLIPNFAVTGVLPGTLTVT